MNSILAITYAFFLSYVPLHNIGFNECDIETYKNATHVEFSLGLDIKNVFHIYCGEETYQIPATFFSYCPYRQSYLIGAEVHYEFNDEFKIKSGIKHKCTHPLNCWDNQFSKNNEANTEIYINISGKLDIL